MNVLDTIENRQTPRSIPEIAWPDSMRILVLAPHPDDFDVIGVTLKHFHKNGNPIHLAVARGGSGVEDDYRPGLDSEGRADLREEEQRGSLDFFGLEKDCREFVSMENDEEGQMVESSANAVKIAGLIRDQRPDIAFLPHGNDTNSAHRAMYRLFTRAVEKTEENIYAFLVCDPKTIEMRVDFYMPYGEKDAVWKAGMLRMHDSQQKRNLAKRGKGFDERILSVNRRAAEKLSPEIEYAETFQLEQHPPESDLLS